MNAQLDLHAPIKQTAQPMSDEWRRWIAENLLLGAHPATLENVLQKNSFSLHTARLEISAALSSPYFQGVLRLKNRLDKRDWVLAISAKLDQIQPLVLERQHQLSGEQFLHDYYQQNRPVIITGMLDDCPARSRWNLAWFREHFSERQVEVQFGRNSDANYEMNSIAHKRQMRFGEYVDLVEKTGHSNDMYMTANNDSSNRNALNELWEDVPSLPEYLKTDQGKQGFFWFGPAGTITPFHHDLTNNFMMQIMGRKRVKLIAPCHLAKLQNERHCFTPVDGRNIDLTRFPQMRDVPVLECILEPGEILFLPVGWWHFVESLDISVTIAATNFRWDNDFFSNYPANHDF
ncbi:cupin-like domain-containing protein [Undibacterium sp. TC9W]|uniref:cupin-like domain-containing protein n=1 Tax=Undibacterium sp. TC9W TaxID=3413053 RepID=UPI003BF1BB08